MQQCGFCSLLSGLLRRAMCVGSRRGSTESYYRELGDQDTLKIEDRLSDDSDDSDLSDDEAPPSPARLSVYRLQSRTIPKRNLNTGRFLTMHKRRRKRLVTRSLNTERALLDDLQNGQVECMLIQSAMWKFNAFTLEIVSGGRCLPVLCVHLFHSYGLIKHFKLDAAKAWKLFSLIEEGYHSTNPYHNSVHAADVTQAMHCFLQQKQIREHLEPVEIMASLLAAIAHDMDHPGVNQPFLIATSNHLAALYHNTSVLENHHWRSAISCVIESGIFDDLQEERPRIEKQISSLILATDITRQQEYLSQFKGHLDTNTLDLTKREHRHLVLQIALKCADISNPCRPWNISRKWSMKVCEEFFRQGDYERQLNLPVSALCDRHNTSIPRIQSGFFQFVVTPLINEWHRFLQTDLSTQMLENLSYNQQKWEALLAREMEAAEAQPDPMPDEVQDKVEETCDDDSSETDNGSDTNSSDSSDLLLPPSRRSSLNPIKTSGLKEQLRRFSVPANVFKDTKSRSQDRSQSQSRAESQNGAERPLTEGDFLVHQDICRKFAAKNVTIEKRLSDSYSVTAPGQTKRLNLMMRDAAYLKLVRQQTFPPLVTSARIQSLVPRPHYTSDEDAIFHRYAKADLLPEWITKGKLNRVIKSDKKDMADDNIPALINVIECITIAESQQIGVLEQSDTKELPFQMQDTACTLPLDTSTYSPKEKKTREMSTPLPQLLCRTLTSKECWSRRRGSAPAPVAPSELRGLAAIAVRHSANGARRINTQMSTCQQWLQKTTVQERAMHLPRRSSLPVEVMAGISSR